jgi:hypothetical protein
MTELFRIAHASTHSNFANEARAHRHGRSAARVTNFVLQHD